MIDVTGIDKAAFAKAVYDLSKPQGLGFIHAQGGALPDEDAKRIASSAELNMDYVHGRACKMNLHVENGKMMAPDSWYDHTDEQYDKLLSQFGFSRTAVAKHGVSCGCESCSPNDSSRNPEAVLASCAHDNELVNALKDSDGFKVARQRN